MRLTLIKSIFCVAVFLAGIISPDITHAQGYEEPIDCGVSKQGTKRYRHIDENGNVTYWEHDIENDEWINLDDRDRENFEDWLTERAEDGWDGVDDDSDGWWDTYYDDWRQDWEDQQNTVQYNPLDHPCSKYIRGFIEDHQIRNTGEAELCEILSGIEGQYWSFESFDAIARNELIEIVRYENPNLVLTVSDVGYLIQKPEVVVPLIKHNREFPNENESLATSEILVDILKEGTKNASLDELLYLEQTVNAFMASAYNGHGLNSHLNLSAISWHQLMQMNWEDKIDFLQGLRKIREAITDGWDWIQEAKAEIEGHFTQLGNAFPQNTEQWQALMVVFGPILLEMGVDIGTDFIPIVGELKALRNSINAFNNGDYLEAGIEFLGGLAGIIPIGDLVRGVGRIATATGTVFAAYKVIKTLSNVSQAIFKNIKSFAEDGWKLIWDDGLEKLFLKANPGAVLRELTEGMARAMEDLSGFSFAKNEDALQLTANAFDEGLDGLDPVEDAVQTVGNDFWSQVRPFIVRGNNYNRTVRNLTPNPYQYHEVTVNKLVNGMVKKYKLDSYNPGQDIVSRKATDFDAIQESTFRKYVNELVNKYEVGLVISKPGTPIHGQTLQGAYKLEVPSSNQSAANLSAFEAIAAEKNVEIIFRSE